jgi:alginate O-acetyltransferase complex protein AlgI
MVFSTHIFLFYFLPLFLLAYFSLPQRWRNGCITVGSGVFYGWWNPWFLLLLGGVTLGGYGCGWLISRPGATERQRGCGLALAVGLGVGALVVFKYLAFCQANLNHVLSWMGARPMMIAHLVLPMGISFYIFKALSYCFDMHREAAPPARSFSDFACYLAAFPQLEAGPIERYGRLAGQMTARAHTAEKFSAGVALFILGLAKKVMLANPAGAIATPAFHAQSLLALDAWVGALAYAFQLYFDFSGYSDMAVGLGRMLGFEFMKNFDAPYRAASITEFWRRWHISLSSWFRDYVFLPLELRFRDSLHPVRRVAANLMVTMLLVGLWHGASWTFVAWGAAHGALLAWEHWRGRKSAFDSLPRPIRAGLTFVLLLLSWVLFRAENFDVALCYFKAMFGLASPSACASLLGASLYTPYHLLILILSAGLVFQPLQAHEWASRPQTWPRVALLVLLFALSVLAMFSQTFSPFLYFQF